MDHMDRYLEGFLKFSGETLPETRIPPGRLQLQLSFWGLAYFQQRTISFREGNPRDCVLKLLNIKPISVEKNFETLGDDEYWVDKHILSQQGILKMESLESIFETFLESVGFFPFTHNVHPWFCDNQTQPIRRHKARCLCHGLIKLWNVDLRLSNFTGLHEVRKAWGCEWTWPISFMYGIFTYIYHTYQPNVGKYTIHGWYGWCFLVDLCSPFLSMFKINNSSFPSTPMEVISLVFFAYLT